MATADPQRHGEAYSQGACSLALSLVYRASGAAHALHTRTRVATRRIKYLRHGQSYFS